jgi:hypothetical protein
MSMPASVPKIIGYAQATVLACTNNKWLPSPNPLVAAVESALAIVISAQTVALTKVVGSVRVRNAALFKLKAAMEKLANQVQDVADENPQDAPAIIESCGFHVKGSPAHVKAQFKVKQGEVAGTALLIALALVGAIAYFWQMSVDQKTWVDITPTDTASTLVTDLTPATTYYFRFRVLVKGGYSEYGPTVSYHCP